MHWRHFVFSFLPPPRAFCGTTAPSSLLKLPESAAATYTTSNMAVSATLSSRTLWFSDTRVLPSSSRVRSPPPSHGSQRASLTMSPTLLSRQECQERQAGRPRCPRAGQVLPILLRLQRWSLRSACPRQRNSFILTAGILTTFDLQRCPDMIFAATPPYDGTLAGRYVLPADLYVSSSLATRVSALWLSH